MAKLFSSLLLAMVGCWLIMASSTEGAYFPFYYYGSSNSGPYLNADDSTADAVPVVINNYDSARLNRPISLYSSVPPGYITDDPTTINGRTFQAFANIFAGQGPFCRPCPTLNCPPPVTCPTCKVCPAVPVLPAATITFSPAAAECLTVIGLLNTGNTISPCTRLSSAPKGTIAIKFTAAQTVLIGIVAASPNTQVKLTCEAIPTGTDTFAKTQLGAITVNEAVTSSGFIQILASGILDNKLTCSWESA